MKIWYVESSEYEDVPPLPPRGDGPVYKYEKGTPIINTVSDDSTPEQKKRPVGAMATILRRY